MTPCTTPAVGEQTVAASDDQRKSTATTAQTHGSHGALLLAVLNDIDGHILQCARTGKQPLVDAVELSRVLRALVEHREEHEPLPYEADHVWAASRIRVLTPAWSWKKAVGR